MVDKYTIWWDEDLSRVRTRLTSHVTGVNNDFIMKVELKSSLKECFSKQDETPFSFVLAAERGQFVSLPLASCKGLL